MLQDLRFTFRLMAKERWYTAVAVIALALGIGVNATVFSIVNGAFLRGLPFKEADRLYLLAWDGRNGRIGVSMPELGDWAAQTRTFSGLAAFRNGEMNISDDQAFPEQASGAWVTAQSFGLIGQSPLLGRDFSPRDDDTGAEPVVILGYRLWQNRYGGDRGVIGKPIRLNGQPATIIGVMPDGVRFPNNTDAWAGLTPAAADERRSTRNLSVYGRLGDGASRSEAQAEMNGIAQQMAVAYPDTNKEMLTVRIETFTERYVGGNARVVFLTMMGAVGFLLVIACANVANLLLSRSAQRAREMAVRIASGATRWRVLRQLLVESVILGCIGGALGLLITITVVPILDAAVQQDPGKPFWIYFAVDYVVLAYVAGLCVLTGIVFGLAPALHVSRSNIADVLKEGGRGTAGNVRVQWLSGTMVVVELSLTIVLLVGAGLMIRSFLNLFNHDLGFESRQLMAMRLRLPESKYATPESRLTFYNRLEPAVAGIAGVSAVATTTSIPPFGAGQRGVEIDRQGTAANNEARDATTVAIAPGFFDVVGLRINRGRAFTAADGAPGFATVVVNEAFVRRFFPGEDPIGRQLRFNEKDPWRTIVGVAPSIRHVSTRQIEPEPVVYTPLRQNAPAGTWLFVRSGLEPSAVMDAVRRAVQGIDLDQPVQTIQTVDQMLDQERWPYRIFGSLFVVFGAIALLLSAVGLYAVMAYSVAQRTQEIGVRMALGAKSAQVSWLVLRRGLIQLAIGVPLGLAGAIGVSGLLRGVLVRITPYDPLTFTAITVVLAAVAFLACTVPARRAMRVDPVIALRAE